MAKANNRNSSIELLRIFSMFAIVLHHYALKGTFNWLPYKAQYSGAIKVNLFFHYFGKLGVVIFVMIGAYFLCEKSFNFRRPINLIVTTVFYSFGLYFIIKKFFPAGIWGNDSLVRLLLPFPLPSGYWFIYSYITLLFAMPFLNIIINAIDKTNLLLLIIGLTILWSFLTIGIWIFSEKPDTFAEDFGYTPATYFFLIYFISAYIRKYRGKILTSKKYTFVGSMVSILIAILFCSIVYNQKTVSGMIDLLDLNSPIVLVSAIFIFSFFNNFNYSNKFINYIAGSMFGVYLIHENSFVRPIIWQRIFSSKIYADSGISYFLFGLFCAFVVFVVTTLIDIVIRRKIFNRLLDWLDKIICEFLERHIGKLIK